VNACLLWVFHGPHPCPQQRHQLQSADIAGQCACEPDQSANTVSLLLLSHSCVLSHGSCRELDNNQLSSLSGNPFAGLTSLQQLYERVCVCACMCECLYSMGLTHVRNRNTSYNQLTSLDSALVNLTSLQQLYERVCGCLSVVSVSWTSPMFATETPATINSHRWTVRL
jgi:hypothetical protein